VKSAIYASIIHVAILGGLKEANRLVGWIGTQFQWYRMHFGLSMRSSIWSWSSMVSEISYRIFLRVR